MHVSVLHVLGFWLCLISSVTADPLKSSHTLTGGIDFAKNIKQPEPSDVKVRVDVATSGQVSLAYTDFPEHALPTPLNLRAVRVDYFDRVQRFDVLAFLKSPMGLLAAFMAFAMFLSPYLKVDPEELANYQKEIEEAKAKKATKASNSAENARLMAASASAGNAGNPTSRLGVSSARQRTKR